MATTIREFYGDDPKLSPDYGRVVNRRNFDRIAGLLGSGKVAVGGQTDPPSAISHRRCWWTFRRTRRYPPYSKHTLERKIQSKLMP
jgi:hypothetical protein